MKPPQPVGPPARINRTIKVRTSYQPRRKKPEFWLPTNTDGSGIVDRLDYSKNGNSLRQEAIYAKLQRKFEKERISGKSVGKVQFDTAVRQSIVNYTDGKRDAYRTLSRPLSARTTPVPEALRKSIESLTTPKER